MNNKYFQYLSLILLISLQGCTTLTDSKTIVVTPKKGQHTVYVESLATSSCWEFFGIFNCDLNIDLHQVHEKDTQTSIVPDVSTQIAATPVVASSKTSEAGGKTLERLKELETLRKNQMISDDEYNLKRQKIMNEF